MLSKAGLFEFLDESSRQYPDAIASIEPGIGSITYHKLSTLTNRLRDLLCDLGVQRGDRVGIYLHKSIDSLGAIFGILKTGAAYVPVDPTAPSARNAYILNDCAVKVVIVERDFVEALKAELDQVGATPHFIVLDGTGAGASLEAALATFPEAYPVTENAVPDSNDLAYILYTSGSTGKPKGVMLTHRAAISFVDWCSEVFEPYPTDRFSSHAPFHFDLSILDIYVPIKHGAAVVLVSEEIGKDPVRLAPLISENKITVWYSTPSILSFLAQFGKMEKYDYSSLRTVLFAGEVFPIKHLQRLKNLLPAPAYYNLYGPTETNVCTYHPIPAEIPPEQTKPFPIGVACSHYQIKVMDEMGQEVAKGEEGELCATSPGMMEGYWNLPERTANAFWIDAQGQKWYKTGDIVLEETDAVYTYISRRDRMVKKRGYRVELGEIESGLYKHPAVKEAAVIATQDEEQGVKTIAFLSCKDDEKPSLVQLKRFCTENLPQYMVPDIIKFLEVLPKTSTDKINYQELKRMVS
ncbi:MAG TPA: amino acid adenylation domain-containing protein [Anaerolineales bacterium]|nr:amino acid adenylation domain-containing protein [Anaerolineales bacterium]